MRQTLERRRIRGLRMRDERELAVGVLGCPWVGVSEGGVSAGVRASWGAEAHLWEVR